MPNGRPPASLIHACSAATYLRRADRLGFTQINLNIRDDGSFDLTGDRGIQSAGTLMTSTQDIWFNGSRGWRANLRRADTPQGPALKLELDDRPERAALRLVSR